MKMRITILFLMFVLITFDKSSVETCQVNEFTCSDGNCIPIAKKCNFDFDCRDRSDEITCPTVKTCPEGLSRCSSGKCVVHQSECSTTANFGNHTTSENKSGNGLESSKIIAICTCVAVVCISCILVLILIVWKKKTSSKSKTDPDDKPMKS